MHTGWYHQASVMSALTWLLAIWPHMAVGHGVPDPAATAGAWRPNHSSWPMSAMVEHFSIPYPAQASRGVAHLWLACRRMRISTADDVHGAASSKQARMTSSLRLLVFFRGGLNMSAQHPALPLAGVGDVNLNVSLWVDGQEHSFQLLHGTHEMGVMYAVEGLPFDITAASSAKLLLHGYNQHYPLATRK